MRSLPHYREFSPDELRFVSAFKRGELVAGPGATILSEGTHSAQLFTVLSGWAFRYKSLEDGRRQILNYLVPGDLAGLQGSMLGVMEHSVESLTPVVLCVFQRSDLGELFREHPSLAFDVTWLAAREERMLDENLLSVGRRSALERAAYVLAFLHRRAVNAAPAGSVASTIPITQQHVADTLGLSLVHTNKTLRRLAELRLIRWRERSCEVLDERGLRAAAHWEGLPARQRPFI